MIQPAFSLALKYERRPQKPSSNASARRGEGGARVDPQA